MVGDVAVARRRGHVVLSVQADHVLDDAAADLHGKTLECDVPCRGEFLPRRHLPEEMLSPARAGDETGIPIAAHAVPSV